MVVAIFLYSCSSRVVYEPQQTAVTSPDAININTATSDELEKLPGVGRKTAEAIVAFRTEHGPFRRVEHLMLVRGLSEARFVEIRSLVRIE
jgi:competence protein ComEA